MRASIRVANVPATVRRAIRTRGCEMARKRKRLTVDLKACGHEREYRCACDERNQDDATVDVVEFMARRRRGSDLRAMRPDDSP